MITTTLDSNWLLSKTKRHGSFRTSLLQRTATVHILLAIVGCLPYLLQLSPFFQALGLGLSFPGAGFIAVGGWWIILGVFCFLFYLAGFFIWWATGNILLPVFIWLLSTVGAAFAAEAPIANINVIAILSVTTLFYVSRLVSNSKKREDALTRRDARNSIMQEAISELKAEISPASPISERELSKEQLDSIRFLYDLGLQPFGTFKGFDIIEQFQPSALRYQFNYVNYALSVLQSQWLPNFHGYLSESQRNMNDKLTHPKVWKYWIYERLWGRLSTNSDPAGFENIMLTGWSGACIATYTANTGDEYFARKGALAFKKNAKTSYVHDIHTFAKSVYENMKGHSICLYPCEPNWVYSICNYYGASFLIAYDRAYGTKLFEEVRENFGRMLEEEFVAPDGRISSFFSNSTGLDIPVMGLGLASDANPSFLLNPILPDFAFRNYAIVRKESISINEQGELTLKTTKHDTVDVGNYKKNNSTVLCYVAQAAAEQGDTKVANLVLKKIDELYEKEYSSTGAYHYKTVSTGINAQIILAKLLQKDDWRNTYTQGPPSSCLTGPILHVCKYPEVLVAKAFSNGEDLDLVLYPGIQDGNQEIKIERLIPNAQYHIKGEDTSQTFIADEKGIAEITVLLSNRSQFSIKKI